MSDPPAQHVYRPSNEVRVSANAVTWLRAALGGRYEPFPWQVRLLENLLAEPTPRALDLPTGLGKTSVMAIWLVARACGARHLPRRLVYVVDRRAVVDQATRVAEELRAWVAGDEEVRAALGLVHELPISTLRGQFVDNKRWLEDPSSPAIVVGTVDMVGSRLLFEGYGCSRKMRPYHAGFLGCDALFVLDEAHLVPPFERLVESIGQDALWPSPPVDVGRPMVVMSLSATGRDYATPFRLDERDRAHAIVQRRVTAPKQVSRVPPEAKVDMHERLAREAWALATSAEGPRRMLVFANSRDTAGKALAEVEKLARAERGRGAALPPTELLVGERRVLERTAAEERLRTLGFLAGDDREPPDDHAFLFTTSAGEVGVDLDADDAVMDVVPWERMVQRLGRVNRRGEGQARVVVLEEVAEEGKDLWRPLVDRLLDALPDASASPDALAAVKSLHPDLVARASSPEPAYPPLSLPLVESWAMTSLAEHTGRPEVGPWLRGWIEEEAQTAVAWRRYLPKVQLDDLVEAAPPHRSEQVDAPTWRVASWLLARVGRLAGPKDPDATALPDDKLLVAALDDADEVAETWTLGQLAALMTDKRAKDRWTSRIAGRTLLVDQRVAGLTAEGLLDDKHEAPPSTLDGDGPWMTPRPDGPAVGVRIREIAADTQEGREGRWTEALRLPSRTVDDEVTHWLVVETWAAEPTSEHSRAASRLQELGDHEDWAGEEALRIATALQLPERLTRALVVAARLHDEGKRAARWQRAFSAPTDGKTYAKTRGPVRVRLLDGYRHELGSLPLAEAHPELRALPDEDRELALHLIAAHHGAARPVIRTTGCDDAPPSMVEERARRVALRYVELQARWGPWRLAWLEALLRSADQTASRRNEEVE